MQSESFGGSRYFVILIDLLKRKSDIFEKFNECKALVETEFGRKIKAVRADRGGKYLSKDFQSYLREHGI